MPSALLLPAERSANWLLSGRFLTGRDGGANSFLGRVGNFECLEWVEALTACSPDRGITPEPSEMKPTMAGPKLKATTIEGGFSLRLSGEVDGDLGVALKQLDSLVVEMEDGRAMGLYPALAELIQSRVVEIVVNMELTGEKALPLLPWQLPSQSPEERAN